MAKDEVVGGRPCEFCRTGAHQHCPEAISEAAGAKGSIWLCPCAWHDHDLEAARRATEEKEDEEA